MARSTGTGRSIPTDTAPAPQHDIPTSTAVTVLCEPDHPSGTWRKEKGAPTATGKQTLPLIQRPGPDQFWNHHPAPPQHPPHSPAGRREVRFREAAPNRNELTPAPAGSAWSSGRRTVNPRNTPAASHVATTCSAALIGCSGSGRRSRRRARGQHPDRLGSGAPARHPAYRAQSCSDPVHYQQQRHSRTSPRRAVPVIFHRSPIRSGADEA